MIITEKSIIQSGKVTERKKNHAPRIDYETTSNLKKTAWYPIYLHAQVIRLKKDKVESNSFNSVGTIDS